MTGSALRLVADHGELVKPVLLPAPVRFLGDGSDALTEATADGLGEHRARYGARPRCRPADLDLRARVLAVGVAGRGGAHVPAALKWSATPHPDVVVANAAESEPGSRKDAALLELRPHLVLDGLASVAEALGAQDAVVWLHAGSSSIRSALDAALDERRRAHLPGPRVRLVEAPTHYLSGESSAVARGVAGGPALPTFRRRHGEPVEGVSTLVHNVETLARIALVARGLDAAGTVLVSVRDAAAITVLEVPGSTALAGVVRSILGHADVQAVLVGGYGGTWLPWATLGSTPLDEAALRDLGVSLGAGVLEPLGLHECGVARAARITRQLAGASARQCGPCLFGLAAIADGMERLAAGRRSRREIGRIEAFLPQVAGRGACHHPDGAVRMVASALSTFEADVTAHLRGRCLHPDRARRRG